MNIMNLMRINPEIQNIFIVRKENQIKLLNSLNQEEIKLTDSTYSIKTKAKYSIAVELNK